MKIKFFLPCRAGSQRIKNKNYRKFYKFKFGLIELKINQLLKVKTSSEIILSTNDKNIIRYAKNLNNDKIKIDVRPKVFASNKTKTDDLIKYASKLFDLNDHILWTHVTSPFFTALDYERVIKIYKANIGKFDTLMGINTIQDFLFYYNKPYNYNFKKTYWPNTQTLKKIYKINNTVFLTSAKNYIVHKNRIGFKIYYYEVEKLKSIDIDNYDDFILAETILQTKKKFKLF